MLESIMRLLDGKKTYLIAVIAGVVFGLKTAGLVDPDIADKVLTGLLIGGGVSMRAGVAKAQNAANGGM